MIMGTGFSRSRMRRPLVSGLLALLLLCAPPAGAAEPDTVTVFAAASTTHAVTELGEIFSARRMGRIVPSFASSSTLAMQIESGAPANLFISADKQWMDYVDQRKLLAPGSRRDLLGNRLVLIAPQESPVAAVEIGPGMDLVGLLARGRLATGDPDHVPAGIYGKQALEHLNLWNAVKERLAPTADVRACLALVERGEVPLGVVYATDAAFSKKVRVVGRFPEGSHPPIVYPAASGRECWPFSVPRAPARAPSST
jgi:molybdate transport system substrate-binding protein